MKVVSRQEAREQGLTRYFTGEPCKHGHVAERRASNKKCLECTKVYLRQYRQTDKYKSWARDYSAERNRSIKTECMTYYCAGAEPRCSSPKCLCPGGVTDLRVLDIDHIEGNGGSHRRVELGTRGGGERFYRWLRDQGYPPGYRVLCKNCNWLAFLEK